MFKNQLLIFFVYYRKDRHFSVSKLVEMVEILNTVKLKSKNNVFLENLSFCLILRSFFFLLYWFAFKTELASTRVCPTYINQTKPGFLFHNEINNLSGKVKIKTQKSRKILFEYKGMPMPLWMYLNKRFC